MARLLCLLRLHRWRPASTEDGSLFRRCARCGKEEAGVRRGHPPGRY